MTAPILVGHDGTATADPAVALARQLAEADAATVVVAHVHEVLLPAYDGTGLHPDAALREEGRRMLDRIRGRHGTDGLTYRLVHARSAAHGLHRLAEELGAAYLVVGASHTDAAGRLTEGSRTEQAVHGAPCPVAVVPETGAASALAADGGPVGAAYDGSPESRAVVRHAAALAAARGTGLRVLRVLEPATRRRPWGASRTEADAREAAATDLAELVLGVDVPVETELVDGDPTEEALRLARDCRVLVTGSRGHGPLHRILLGSVSTRLVRRATRPVIVLPRRTTPPPPAIEDPGDPGRAADTSDAHVSPGAAPSGASPPGVEHAVIGGGDRRRAPMPGGPSAEVLIGGGRDGGMAAVHVVVPAGGGMPAHDHGASEALLTALAGVAWLHRGDGDAPPIRVEPGVVTRIPIGRRVELRNDGEQDARLLAVFAPGDFAARFADWPRAETAARG